MKLRTERKIVNFFFYIWKLQKKVEIIFLYLDTMNKKGNNVKLNNKVKVSYDC